MTDEIEIAEVPPCDPENEKHYFPDGKTCLCGETVVPTRPADDNFES